MFCACTMDVLWLFCGCVVNELCLELIGNLRKRMHTIEDRGTE